MTEKSHALVRDVFELDVNEEIFYEFSCSLSQTASMPGRLYITEHFLCFSANVLGIETKVSLIPHSDSSLLVAEKNRLRTYPADVKE